MLYTEKQLTAVEFTGGQYYWRSLLLADRVNLNSIIFMADSVNGEPILMADHFTGGPNIQS